MKGVELVNRVCYALCLITIVFGATTAVLGIWIGDLADVAWKGLATAGVIFTAGLSTIAVNNALASRVIPDRRLADSADPDRG